MGNHKFDLLGEIDLSENEFWFDKYVLNQIELNGGKIMKIDIWDKSFLDIYSIEDPRSNFYSLLHWYLAYTNNYQNLYIVKFIDAILKMLDV